MRTSARRRLAPYGMVDPDSVGWEADTHTGAPVRTGRRYQRHRRAGGTASPGQMTAMIHWGNAPLLVPMVKRRATLDNGTGFDLKF